MPKAYHVKDHYFQKAKEDGYRARSAYKLMEIQRKFSLVQVGDKVLDLGAAPGSFLQVLAKWVGPKGKVWGLDLQTIEAIPGVKTAQVDIFDVENLTEVLEEDRFNVVTSDLAPATSGIKDVDQVRSVELSLQALRVAQAYLVPGGRMIVKIFQGEDFSGFLKEFRARFNKVKCFKPLASRDRSRETYVMGWGFREK